MKKRVISIIFALFFSLTAIMPAFATSSDNPQYVYSDKKLFDESELRILNEMAHEVYLSDNVGIYAFFVDDTGGKSVSDYARDFYEEVNVCENGIVLVYKKSIMHFEFFGDAGYAITDADRIRICEMFESVQFFSDGVKEYIIEAAKLYRRYLDSETKAAILRNLTDNAGLLSNVERTTIKSKLNKISSAHRCSVAIVTVNSLEGENAAAYAADVYKDNHYGFKKSKDGILLLLDAETNTLTFYVHGNANDVFTDSELEYMEDQLNIKLEKEGYMSAFTVFVNLCSSYFVKAEQSSEMESVQSNSYNQGTLNKSSKIKDYYAALSNLFTIERIHMGISVIIGIAAAFIFMKIKKDKLKKNVHFEVAAKSYVRYSEISSSNESNYFDTNSMNNSTGWRSRNHRW